MPNSRSLLGSILIGVNPGETENEWQKTKQVPNLLLMGARSFLDAKKSEKKNC